MPLVYRWLLTLSGVVFLIVSWADGRPPYWGYVEQVLMGIAGLFILYVAWKPMKRCVAHIGVYVVVIGGLFEIVNHVADYIELGERPFIAAAFVWGGFVAYTTLLLAFGWVGQGPQE
jgi:hypothetical protein